MKEPEGVQAGMLNPKPDETRTKEVNQAEESRDTNSDLVHGTLQAELHTAYAANRHVRY